MSISYFILCHELPLMVADLFRTLYNPRDTFLIHVDRKAPDALHRFVASLAGGFGNVYEVPTRYCSWGGSSLVDATLDAMAFALDSVPDWHHFIPLSEHHLPLFSADVIRGRLSEGVSWSGAIPVAAMNPGERQDVEHRFAQRYRELPGVGSFGCDAQDLPASWWDRLHHGSQWMVLARAACKALRRSLDDSAVWDVFRHSLLADETALQTILLGAGPEQSLPSVRHDSTFAAFPHLSHSPAMIFTDENFRAARDAGYLFIRKRPARLSPEVARIIEGFAGLGVAQLETHVGAIPRSETPQPLPPYLAERLRLHLSLAIRAAQVVVQPSMVNAPRCFVWARLPDWPQYLNAVLLSETLEDFKVTLACDWPFNGDFAPLSFGADIATVIRARLQGLLFAREINLGPGLEHGFAATPGAAANLFVACLQRGEAVAPLLRALERTYTSGPL